MQTDLGTELPQRSTLVWAGLACAVFFAIPAFRTVRAAIDEREMPTVALAWLMAVALLLAVVVLPLLIAWHVHQRHTFVSDEMVTRVQGAEVKQQMRFADIEEVRVRFDGGLGAATPEWLNEAVVMVGTDQSGRRRQMRVSRVFVTTLQPLLRRLADEVRRRPELIRNDAERTLFDGAVTEAD